MIYSLKESIVPGKNIIGNKGQGLMEMMSLGLPVPRGFVLAVDARAIYQEDPQLIFLRTQQALEALQKETGCLLGDGHRPLFVSVRSGAPVSMPGMMDTFLNVGISLNTLTSLAKRLGSEKEAWHTYFLYIKRWGYLIFEKELPFFFDPHEEPREQLAKLLGVFEQITGQKWCDDPHQQLYQAIQAVWSSWHSPRAKAYRHHQKLSQEGGTAVIVQAMVFGNAQDQEPSQERPSLSGTGVCFTRNPSTGEKGLFGECLFQAQGEELVSGARTPEPLHALAERDPVSFCELQKWAEKLELFYQDMQDLEWTIERGKLWILQTRSAKRTVQAAVRLATDLVKEGVISSQKAIHYVDAASLVQLLQGRLTSLEGLTPLGQGKIACGGVVTGRACFEAKKIEDGSILILEETSCEDMPFMIKSKGVVTFRGGMTSHAAVVMRGVNIPCLVALKGISKEGNQETHPLFFSETPEKREKNSFTWPCGEVLHEGDWITLDGTTGTLFKGKGEIDHSPRFGEVEPLLQWADEKRQMTILVNADTPEDIKAGLALGAEGVGLVRTEHMLFEERRLRALQTFLLTSQESSLKELCQLHQEDLYRLMHACGGYLLTVRLLDPPLHEFFPQTAEHQEALALSLGWSTEQLSKRLKEYQDVNPMLGHRGCRLALTTPQIYRMQIEAMAMAQKKAKEQNLPVALAIMVPFIVDPEEFNYLRQEIESLWCQHHKEAPLPLIGSMIETPRACLLARRIAHYVDFISFGTNDLTQMTWALSRDDGQKFMPCYQELGIADPFETFDVSGVGALMKICCQEIRAVKPTIKIGVCGEHASCPKAIQFFQRIGINALSSIPLRIATTRLAAAQVACEKKP